MWTVRSEAGELHAVLVQDSVVQFWERKFPFIGVESNSLYLARCPHADIDEGQKQWRQLPHYLDEEGVQVFEVASILHKVLEGATSEERRRIVDVVWEGMPVAPEPGKLTVEHLLGGYPSKAYYDEDADRVVLPDFQRVGWPYPRDTSFTTQVGTVICNMRRYSRRFEPRVVKLAYEYDPVLAEKTEIIWDANQAEAAYTEPPCIEGGDTHVVDEETLAIGIGQRSTFTGFMETARRIFERDGDREIRHICAVRMPDYPASDYMHLDVVINYPDAGRALVMPYFFESELVKDMPPRGLLLMALEALKAQSERDGRPMEAVVHPADFEGAGSCSVYARGESEPKLVSREVSLVDYLVREGKLEADGLIYVGGRPVRENDVEHMMLALMEQARGAPNIITVRPGLVIAYERNRATNEELRSNGIRVKEWDDSYLDLLGGPHCSTSPLWRDPA
jgi:N-dimethylarginine dimethylaminohydrolase